jgi:hypothetical protein
MLGFHNWFENFRDVYTWSSFDGPEVDQVYFETCLRCGKNRDLK